MMSVSVLQQFRSIHVSLKLTSNSISPKTFSALFCPDGVSLVTQGLGLILWCFGWMSEITLCAKPGTGIPKPSHPALFSSYFLFYYFLLLSVSAQKNMISEKLNTSRTMMEKTHIKMIISLGPRTAHGPAHKSYTHSKINKLLWWETICSYWGTIY